MVCRVFKKTENTKLLVKMEGNNLCFFIWKYLKQNYNKILKLIVKVLIMIFIAKLINDGVVSSFTILCLAAIFAVLGCLFYYLADRMADDNEHDKNE